MNDQDATSYTYEAAAKLCGVSAETIRQRARRGKLRRGRPNNANRPTVLLTPDEIDALRNGRPFRVTLPGQPNDDLSGHVTGPDNQTAGQSSTIKALTDHLDSLRQQLGRSEAAADAARQARDADLAKAIEDRAAAALERARLLTQIEALTAALHARPAPGAEPMEKGWADRLRALRKLWPKRNP